ncbi:hypothetical protein KM043_007207 [Ampulex compressa]|nr:hypothetical protein KM043_007207 [Ampulex compressa]
MVQERSLMGRADMWHKIKILGGARYDKDYVLKSILNAVEPADLIPVKYQISEEDSFFIAKNCGAALDKLCQASLIIKNTEGDPLILVITLGFASIHDLKVNIQPMLLSALTRRYDPNKKTLNLQSFHKDSDVDKIVYCPLSRWKAFSHVLKLAKNAISTFECLNVQGNELTNISAIEHCTLSFIKHLDLRYNNLLNMETLNPLKQLTITRLWLDGNPLCENYSSPKQYIESARRYCPCLNQLDGVYVHVMNMPLVYIDYFKDEKRRTLVHKFVNHFFNLYDQMDRTFLRGLYHRNALYSMSFGIPAAIAHKTNLGQFTASRNLLKVTDPSRRSLHLYHGQDNILMGLKKLPRSYHDKNTFVYDLMYDNGKTLAISVTGLFKKPSADAQVLAFYRTFVLLAGPENEYNILNDQYHVDFAPEGVTSNSIEVKLSYEEFVPICFNRTEKADLLNRLQKITSLSTEWCKSYLQEAKWDLRKALSHFIKDYKSSDLPREAFIK